MRRLSTHSRFLVFARDFLPARRATPAAAFTFQASQRGESRGFLLSLRAAAEFLSKKDYLDNWRSELNEEFCFWGFSQWKAALSETGFRIVENPNQPEQSSRVYTNPWIAQNRFEAHVRIFAVGGALLPWPPTNMVLVAEKPDH